MTAPTNTRAQRDNSRGEERAARPGRDLSGLWKFLRQAFWVAVTSVVVGSLAIGFAMLPTHEQAMLSYLGVVTFIAAMLLRQLIRGHIG